MKALRPLFLVVSLMLMVGLACSVGNSSKPTDEPTKASEPTTVVDEPTEAVDQPTEEVVDEPTEAVDEPTEESTTEAQQFYTETFDGSLDNYTYFNTGEGDEDKMSLKTNDGYLVFDLKGENLWIYVTYDPFTYKDVALEVTADNRGKNTNDISLLCRYDKEEGWYEFNVKNSGLYSILAYDATGIVKKGYNTIYNGASKAVKQGRDVNTYSASCVGEKLTLTINGTEVKTIKDTKFRFREGKVGFSVSSYNVLPILVDVDSFTISEP